MIDHISTYATDFTATKSFYEACLAPLGIAVQFEMEMTWDTEFSGRHACSFGPSGKSVFWVIEVKEPYSPRHIAFEAEDRKSVAAFYEAALGAGGTDHGAPGLRPEYHEHYFGGFVLDPDQNNVEAVCHVQES